MKIGKLGKILIITIISIILFNFIGSNYVMADYDEGLTQQDINSSAEQQLTSSGVFSVATSAMEGLAVVVLKIAQALVVIPLGAATNYLSSAVGSSAGTIDGSDNMVTVEEILFNKLAITDINFFNISTFGPINNQKALSGNNNPIKLLKENIAKWYMALRQLAIIISICVLIYIGIRMAIASTAESKKNYKQMLMNWAISLAMVFLLHYIILLAININNVLVDIIGSVNTADKGSESFLSEYMSQQWKTLFTTTDLTQMVSETMVYIGLSVMTIIFLVMYIKRMITVAFLILISPLITIIYSIDKAGDGKAQALGSWLKEFMHSIFIQPFHCLIYASIVSITISLLKNSNSLAGAAIMILTLWFTFEAEKIVKKIFGINSESTGNSLATALMISHVGGQVVKPMTNTIGKWAGQGVGYGVGQAKRLKNSWNADNNISKANVVQEENNKPTNNIKPENNFADKLNNADAESQDYFDMMGFDGAEKNHQTADKGVNGNNIGRDNQAEDAGKKAADEASKGAAKDAARDAAEQVAKANAKVKADADVNANINAKTKANVDANNSSKTGKNSMSDMAEKAFRQLITTGVGLGGAMMGLGTSGMAGADMGEVISSGLTSNSIGRSMTEAGIKAYDEKINKMEGKLKDIYIKDQEKNLATVFANYKGDNDYNMNKDINKVRDYLDMSEDKIQKIKSTSEKQYVQGLHAMRDIYGQNLPEEDANEKVVKTMKKIISEEIKAKG